MPVKSHGITSHYPLKMRPEERAVAEQVQRVYARYGVEMSLNEAFRHLIRRGAIVLAHTPEQSRRQIAEHSKACPDCELESEAFRCPDGLYLHRNHQRVVQAHSGAELANAL